MGKQKELTATLIRADEEILSYFIKVWSEFSRSDETPEELAESVQNNFFIQCNANDIIKAFSGKLEIEDSKQQMKNLNLYQ